MPGTFLTAKERERLASFPDAIPHWDLITSFTLTDEDHTFIQTYRSDPHRLGVALQLGAVRYLGFCPTHLQAAPLDTIAFLAEQLHVDPTVFQDYGTRRMTQSAHFQAVLDHLGFRRVQDKEHEQLLTWLTERALLRPTWQRSRITPSARASIPQARIAYSSPGRGCVG